MRRREFLQASGLGLVGTRFPGLFLQEAPRGDRPAQAEGVKVLNPRGRVPVSLLIDDSTCLVNLAHFCIPQFAHVFPDRVKQDWRKLPREIPDAFVRKFGEWCRENGVKGKYSVIPYPAMVGWVDREMPGWTKRQLEASLALMRDFMSKDWDFTPEMVTHTRVIDPKTGRALEPYDESTMENWGWSQKRSVDELADYLAFALRPLRNAGIDATGVTSPGGFGGKNLPNYSKAVLQACRDVFKTEIPFYLKKVNTDDKSVAPEVLYASGLEGDDPQCVVSVIGCTGDWFGGWDGLEPGAADKFITEDFKGGRLPQVIAKGEPAVMVSHWPGQYFNGEEVGFTILKEIVKRLRAGCDNLVWMKFSELGRYWAAKELTKIEKAGGRVDLRAPFACPEYTMAVAAAAGAVPKLTVKGQPVALKEVPKLLALESGTWTRTPEGAAVCFDLPKGPSRLELA
ncbi:MAG: hypothetical protein HY293_02395 [Planctomycetes bacterium]|nr:hypothetical protein [Planctomycetota bacterium]